MRCCSICPSAISEYVQGTGALSGFHKIDLVVDLDIKADLGEGCVPGGGKFGLQ